MKKLLLLSVVVLLTTSCAYYGTTQEDITYVEGKPSRKITTKVGANTFWAGKSELAKSAVTQTDKSQSSRVGALTQVVTNSAVQDVTALVVELNKLKKP